MNDLYASSKYDELAEILFRQAFLYEPNVAVGLVFQSEAVAQSPESCSFIKKETLAQMFFREFCKISRNTFSYRTPPIAASVQ